MTEPKPLTKRQVAALRELGAEPGRYRVNWRPLLGRRGYLDLLERGYIDEQWTWASGTRPDVGITHDGIVALALLNNPGFMLPHPRIEGDG